MKTKTEYGMVHHKCGKENTKIEKLKWKIAFQKCGGDGDGKWCMF